MKRIGKASMATMALAASLTMLVAGCGSGGSSNNTSNSGGTTSNSSTGNNSTGGSNTTSSSNNTSSNSTSSKTQPVDGGTLTMALGTAYDDSLIPDMDASLYTADVQGYMFDYTLTVDKNLNFVSDIIKTWDWSSDKKTVTMHIDPNAKWSDGQPLTSDDMLFTLNYLASKTYNTTLQGQYGYLVGPIVGSDKIGKGTAKSFADTGGFKKIDDKTFSLTFQSVDAAVLYSDIAAIQPIPEHILSKTPMKDWLTSDFNKKPTVGDGPYIITAVNGQSNVEFKANPDYFMGKPHISNLVIKVVTPDVEPGLLSNGSVQYVLSGLKPTDYSKLKTIPGVEVKAMTENGFSYLGLKLYKKEFQDVKVRQAFEYGLDRKSMIQGIEKGLATPINGPLPPVSWAAATAQDGMNQYEYNPTKAGQLLDQAGWKMGSDGYRIDPVTGKEANLTLSYSSGSPTVQAEAVAIKQNFKKIGVKVTLNSPMDFNTLAKDVETDNKVIQMWLMGWSLGTDPDPRGLWDSKDAMNFPRWKDTKNDQLIADTWGAKAFDKTYRKQAFVKWQLYVNKNLPYVFLWAPDNLYAYSSKLQIPANDWSVEGPLNIQDWWLQQ